MSEYVFRFTLPVLAALAHGVAYLQFRLRMDRISLPSRWFGQFVFLIVLSLSLALVLPFLHRTAVRWWIILLRGFILLLISLPLGEFLWVDLSLLLPLILETGVYTNLVGGLLYNILLTIFIILIRSLRFMAWNTMILPRPAEETLFFGIYAGLLIVVSAYLQYQQKYRISSRELNKRLNDATLQLAEANIQLQHYAAMAKQEAAANERKRVAREMHDTVAYTLTNLVMMLDAAVGLAVTDSENLVDHLSHVRARAQEGLTEVRRTLQALRPVQLTEIRGLPAIKRLVSAFADATRIEVKLNLGSAPLVFGEEADLVAYRLVQEGMTNALRHGKATLINISFSQVNDGVGIQIKDNGIGANGIKEGFGLVGMRERIERLGGRLEVYTKFGEGFTLNAWIPLESGAWESEKIGSARDG